jgi:dUTP pyrophosphatase
MKINIKLEENAIMPTKGSLYSAGYDLYATSINSDYKYIEYETGISMEIPEGYVGFLFPRSSISNKSLILANSVGVIDSDYRGTIKLRFKKNLLSYENDIHPNMIYKVGDRIGQIIIMPYPDVTFEQVLVLNESNRNDNGFGSTGN